MKMKAALAASFVIHMVGLALAPGGAAPASPSDAAVVAGSPSNCDLEITANPEPESVTIARGPKL
jgi:hypothetical protein